MHGKVHEGIRTVRPLSDGVIADFNAAEHMIRGMIKKVSAKNHWFSPSLRMVVCVPSGSTEVEIRAVRDSSEHAGGRDVYMIYEPMAAALGIGLDVLAPEGNMIVDIGGGTTEIAVISLGGIVSNKSIRTAGDDLTEDIQEHMRRAHNVRVGERTAEAIKINVGSALTDLGPDAPEDFIIHGPNQVNSLPLEVPVTYQEVCHEIHLQDRGCRPQRPGADASRAVSGHRPQRYLPDWWWCLAAWSGPSPDRQDRHRVPCRRGSPARCGKGYRHRTEEHQALQVPHALIFFRL